MPPLKQKTKNLRQETRSPEEVAIQSASTSSHHIMIPLWRAEHTYVRHPILNKDIHLSTSSSQFYELIYELCQKGLKDKIFKDIEYFINNYDANWIRVRDALTGYIKAKETE